MLKRARKTAVDQHLRKSLASCESPQCLCIGQDGMGLCVKSGLRTASPTSASPLLHSCRVTSGRCLRPSERTPIPSPPTPSLPPPRPRQVPQPSFLPLSLVVWPVRGAGQVPLEECEGEKLIYLHSHQHRPALADIGQRVPQPTHEAELGTKEA